MAVTNYNIIINNSKESLKTKPINSNSNNGIASLIIVHFPHLNHIYFKVVIRSLKVFVITRHWLRDTSLGLGSLKYALRFLLHCFSLHIWDFWVLTKGRLCNFKRLDECICVIQDKKVKKVYTVHYCIDKVWYSMQTKRDVVCRLAMREIALSRKRGKEWMLVLYVTLQYVHLLVTTN